MSEYIPAKDSNFMNNLLEYCASLSKIPGRYTSGFRYKVFTYLVCATGKNAFPSILKDEDYDAFNGMTLYRGTYSAEFHAQLLCDHDYHYGVGYGMNGIYASSVPGIASAYSSASHDKNSLIEFKLAPWAKIMSSELDYDMVTWSLFPGSRQKIPGAEELVDFINQHRNDKGCELLLRTIQADVSSLALLLGYDAVYETSISEALPSPYSASNPESIAILNRGAIVASRSTFNDVTRGSEVYRGGRINHEKKIREDLFLDE